MFKHYMGLGWRSLRRDLVLTWLMIIIMAFGVAATSTTYSIFRAASGNPIPWKSAQLFFPQIDAQGPEGNGQRLEPDSALDYFDAQALMRYHRAHYQSAMYRLSLTVIPPQAGQLPQSITGHALDHEFFPMVDVPFRYGGPWSASDDQAGSRVIVISAELNQSMFGGRNSVGRTLTIDGNDFTVVGVMQHWDPEPHFYDLFNADAWQGGRDDILMPFRTAINDQKSNNGTVNCSGDRGPGFDGLLHSRCVWIAMMVQLDSPAQVGAYRAYLDAYAKQQQLDGRYPWSPNNRLRDLPAWLDHQGVVPPDTTISTWVALALLLVCLVNTIGLMLAKFMRRGGEIGIRRALGASRGQIYLQFVTESVMTGLAGGALSLVLTALGVWVIAAVMPDDVTALAHTDGWLLAGAVLMAMAASGIAGLYPAYRASRIQPALQLKTH